MCPYDWRCHHSKAHTAVKIAPTYERNQTIYVSDASRAVGVASKLISKEHRDAFVAEIQLDYDAVRLRTANRTQGERCSPTRMRLNKSRSLTGATIQPEIPNTWV